MTIRVSVLVVCLLAGSLAAQPGQTAAGAPVAAPTVAHVEAIAAAIFAAWDVPGAGIAVVKDGQVVLSRGFGPSTDAGTSFYTASVTKTFTIAALGMLADEGKVRIDDPVVKYLPEFATADASLSAQLTVRDLMAHRTGLPRADLLMFSGLTDNEVLARLRGLPASAPIRSRFTYQNQMYLALGEIITRVSGRPWSQFITERLLTPLGMTQSSATGLGTTPLHVAGAQPHARLDGKVQPIALVPRAPYGAGGVNSTARDLGTWLQFLLGDGTWHNTRLLGPQVINATRNPQVMTPTAYFAPDAVLAAYGLGWFLNDYHGHLIVQHGGNGEGWTSMVWLQPDLKLGVAVLTNMHNTMLPWAVAYSIADAYAGRPARNWTAHFQTAERARVAAQAKQTPMAVDGAVDARAWRGSYSSSVYGTLRIVERNGDREGRLELEYGPALRATLRPVAAGVAAFWQRSDILAVLGPSPLRLSERGADSVLTLQLGGDTVEFIRAR